MSRIVAHGNDAAPASRAFGEYIGNPMYGVIPEHVAAFVAVAMVAIAALVIRRGARSGGRRSQRLASAYRRLDPTRRFVLWLVVAAGAVHAGLVLGHEPGAYSLAFGFAAVAEMWVARRLLFVPVPVEGLVEQGNQVRPAREDLVVERRRAHQHVLAAR